MDSRFRAVVEQARKSDDLYFAALLSKDRITQYLREAGAWFQGWVCTGAVTTWVFLSQCLSADHSCREAVAKLVAWRVKNGHSAISSRILNGASSERKSVDQALTMLRNSPDSKPVIELVNRIVDLHPVASRYFFKGLGLQLMTIESTIMLDILDKTTEAGKPALGIHDAVLCLNEDKDYVKRPAKCRDQLSASHF